MKPKLRLPQARVLNALLSLGRGATLTRAKLEERAGFKPKTGRINPLLNVIPKGSSCGPPHPGVIELGFVSRNDNVD
jgi:hypothetical protein